MGRWRHALWAGPPTQGASPKKVTQAMSEPRGIRDQGSGAAGWGFGPRSEGPWSTRPTLSSAVILKGAMPKHAAPYKCQASLGTKVSSFQALHKREFTEKRGEISRVEDDC